MMIEKLLELLSQDNISIQYTNINGEEKLIVNGKELSSTNNMISKYKDNLDKLDDDIFVEATEEISELYDLSKVDELFNKTEFTEEEEKAIPEIISTMSDIIIDTIQSRIDTFEDTKSAFANT